MNIMPQPANPAEKTPIVPYATEETLPKPLQEVLAKYKTRMGFLPNALGFYFYRPEIAQPLFTLNSAIMRDASQTLPQQLKRELAAVCSKANGCTYCLSHSCAMLGAVPGSTAEAWGLSEQQVEDIVSGRYRGKDEFERACYDFCWAASTDPANVPQEIHDRLTKHLTPPQIVELACVVGFWKFYNTVHDSLNIPLEHHLFEQAKFAEI